MPTYGVTPTGFLRKPVTQILADIEAVQRAEISPNLDLSAATPWGQNNGIFANELGTAWEILEVCYNAFDPDAAQDFLLTSLSKLTGTERRAADYSLVVLECDLDEGTTIESGVHFAAVDGDTTSLWTPVEDFESPSDGTHEITFRAENPGPVPAQTGTITVIQTALVGWNAVTNPEAAELGRTVDTDETLRTRREGQLTASGSGTADGVRADVLELEGVETCTVFENDSDDTVDGMPPHSIEVLIFDGEIASVDNDVVAQAIWNTKGAGIETVGGATGTATDAQGNARIVYFSRPTLKPIYISLTVVPSDAATYAAAGGDGALESFLADSLKALHGIGEDVKWRRIDSLAFQFGTADVTIEDVTAFTLGLTISPVGTTNIPIAPRELATFDASRITVTS